MGGTGGTIGGTTGGTTTGGTTGGTGGTGTGPGPLLGPAKKRGGGVLVWKYARIMTQTNTQTVRGKQWNKI